jgi:hypothetical protein
MTAQKLFKTKEEMGLFDRQEESGYCHCKETATRAKGNTTTKSQKHHSRGIGISAKRSDTEKRLL